MELKINPIAKHPTFNMDTSVTDVDLVEFNPLLRWQWGVDVHKGLFAMFVEAEAKEGGFRGYVKPFIHDLDMVDERQDRDKSLGKKIKEAVVGAVATVFKNPKTENVASKVPFEGRFDRPDVGTWEAVATILHNALIKALSPNIERSIK